MQKPPIPISKTSWRLITDYDGTPMAAWNVSRFYRLGDGGKQADEMELSDDRLRELMNEAGREWTSLNLQKPLPPGTTMLYDRREEMLEEARTKPGNVDPDGAERVEKLIGDISAKLPSGGVGDITRPVDHFSPEWSHKLNIAKDNYQVIGGNRYTKIVYVRGAENIQALVDACGITSLAADGYSPSNQFKVSK